MELRNACLERPSPVKGEKTVRRTPSTLFTDSSLSVLFVGWVYLCYSCVVLIGVIRGPRVKELPFSSPPLVYNERLSKMKMRFSLLLAVGLIPVLPDFSRPTQAQTNPPSACGIDARMMRYPDVSATQIAFVYAGDIWVAPKSGGPALRLSSPKGEESFPRFSPDG